MSASPSARAGVVVTMVVVLVASASLSACKDAEPFGYSSRATRGYPKAGLFTPGSTLGYEPPQVGGGADGGGLTDEEVRAFDEAIQEGSSQDRCVGSADGEGTPGTLDIEFGTATYHGHYEPTNVGAVWIEDAEGNYIATPLLWAGVRTRNLFVWDARRCEDDPPDVISSATLDDHSTPHTANWDGLDIDGKVVPDGTYVVNVEVTEDEFNYGRRVQVPFDKGKEPVMLEPEDTESVKAMTLVYTPAS